MDIRNRIYIYGLDELFNVVRYTYIDKMKTEKIIWELILEKRILAYNYPSVKIVYAVDNCYDVYKAYKELVMSGSNLEEKILFKQLLEQYGIRLM